MQANRIRHYQPRFRIMAEPQRPAPAIPPGFAVCPPHLATAHTWQQEIYRRAYEQAKATAEIPRHYRRMFSTWN